MTINVFDQIELLDAALETSGTLNEQFLKRIVIRLNGVSGAVAVPSKSTNTLLTDCIYNVEENWTFKPWISFDSIEEQILRAVPIGFSGEKQLFVTKLRADSDNAATLVNLRTGVQVTRLVVFETGIRFPRMYVEVLSYSDLPFDQGELLALFEFLEVFREVSSRERMQRAIGIANHLFGVANLAAAMEDLSGFLKRLLPCQGVSLFVAAPNGRCLKPIASTGIRWISNDKFQQIYRPGEGLVGHVWNLSKPFSVLDARSQSQSVSKSTEIVENKKDHFALLFPISSSSKGKVVALIRLRNRIRPYGVSGFCDSDIEFVDRICTATKSVIEILYNDTSANSALGWLSHELKGPLGLVASAANEIGWKRDIPNDIRRECELIKAAAGEMSISLRNTDLFRTWPQPIMPQRKMANLNRDIVQPSIKNVAYVMRKRGITAKSIGVSDSIEEAPVCQLDTDLMVLALTNVLANAVVYCERSDSIDSLIQLEFKLDYENGQLDVEDWGCGFDHTMINSYFLAGARHPSAPMLTDKKQGLGLWASHRCLEIVGGDVRISNCRKPTRVSIIFPLKMPRNK